MKSNLKPFKLNLDQTAEVILKWINSVDTKEQLDLTKEAIETFITSRFPDAPERDMYNARYKLDLAIYEKEAIILFS